MQTTLAKVDPATLDYKELLVDPNNVKEIERQILAWGGIHTPVEVWIEGNKIMDGFHRTTAAVNLGMPEIDILLFECTESEFWDKRISQAKKHVAVADDRLHAWILSAWQAGEFKNTERNQSFTDAIYAIHQGLSGSEKFKLNKNYRSLQEWFTKKSNMWGRPALEVAGLILEHEKVFSPQFPEAKAIAREENLTADQTKKLTKAFPKGNKTGFGKGLNKGELKEYAKALIETNESLTQDDWKAQKAQEKTVDQQRRAIYLETPAGIEEKRRRRIENGVESIQALRIVEHRITDLLQVDLAEIMLARPDLNDSVKRFFDKVNELGALFGASGVFSVPDENERLTLLARITELERDVEQAKRSATPIIVAESSLALAESQLR